LEVVGELPAKLYKMDEQRLRLECPATRVWDLLLGPSSVQARLTDRLDEAARQLRAELAVWLEADVEMEALWDSATRVWDFMVGNANGLSSLAASMCTVVELLEGRIAAAAPNGVHWGSCLELAAAVLHFPELKTKMEVLNSGHIADLTGDEADALWI
jgi:hypothetical protein